MAIERDQIDTLIKKMRRILKLLGDDFFDDILPANLATLHNGGANDRLKDNITKLETAITLLKSLEDTDPFGTDPTLGNQRLNLLAEISRVKTYFETELIPKIQDFHSFLLQRGEREYAQQLQEILPEVLENPAVARSLPGKGPTYAEETIVRRQQAHIRVPHESSRSSLVTIARNHLEQLEEHQRRLNKFVHGYIKAHEHWINWTEIQSELEEGRPASDKSWSKIKKDLQKQVETAEDIIKSLVTVEEIHDHIQELAQKLVEARGMVKAVAELPLNASAETVKEAIDQVCNQMDGMLMKLEIIEEKCQDGAETELHEVDKLITAISSQVQETREAAERSRSAPVAMTIDFVRRASEGEKTTERSSQPNKPDEN